MSSTCPLIILTLSEVGGYSYQGVLMEQPELLTKTCGFRQSNNKK